MKTKKITNRDIAVRTATALFLTRGYLATSMDEIVTASKVSKTNIYYYFKSKDELLAAIMDELIGAYTMMIQDIASQKQLTVHERMERLLRTLSGQNLNCLSGCPFLTLYSQIPSDAPQLKDKVGRFFQDQISLVEKLIDEGIELGQLRSALPARSVAQLIVSAIEGSLFLQHASQEPDMLEHLLQTLAILLK